MKSWSAQALVCAFTLALTPALAAAETLRIASPQRGSWEGAIPDLGQQQGIFKQHGLDLDILYTSGGGETLQAVLSASVDVGQSAGIAGSFGAFSKGAPLRILAPSSTGSRETFWYVRDESPLKNIREAAGKTIAYSTTGASSQVAVLHFIKDYGLIGAKAVATGDVSATITQVMSGQVDVGWSVAPFNLDALRQGKIRIIARSSDIDSIRKQTIRVDIVNARILVEKKDALDRYMDAYRETIDWMYSSDEAINRYLALSGFSEESVRQMLADFIPKMSLQTTELKGVSEAMQDAIDFKFLSAPLTDDQLSQVVQIPPLR